MNQLTPIEHSNHRVLTTAQLAESFGTDTNSIVKNFNNNKDRYMLRKHYFLLEGEELKSFKGEVNNLDVASNVNKLYLWTEKGAWLHAKSLNTDSAWESYEALVDDYYAVKQQAVDTSLLSPEMQMFKLAYDAMAKMQLDQAATQKALQGVQTAVTTIKETIIQREDDWRASIKTMFNTAVQNSTNKDFQAMRNETYRILEERAHCDLNTRLRNLRARLEESGATKSQIDKISKLDVIEADPKLKEIYTSIIKEISIRSMEL
jgi:hypothetical protein